jgi:hypothetical protein
MLLFLPRRFRFTLFRRLWAIPRILVCAERRLELSFFVRRWQVVTFYLLDLSQVFLSPMEILLSVRNKMSEWLMAVKEAHAKLKKKDPKATLAQAMKEAKKTYKPKPKK